MDTEAGQVTDGDITIDSNHETVEQIETAFQDDPPVADAPDAVEAVAPVEGDVPETPKKRKRRSDPTEAVKSAVAKQREAERRAAAAESRVQELSSAPPVAQPAAQPEAKPAPQPASWSRFKEMPGVPRPDQFTAYEDYSMALAEFVSDAKQNEQRAAHEQQQIAQEQQVQLDRWSQTLNDAREANPAFDESLNLDTPMSLPMQHLAMESEQGIGILQWLSDHPDDAQRISTLHPAETYREMGKLEARLEAASSTEKSGPARVVSSAKAPIKPLGTSPPVEDPFEITDDLSMDEHFRRMNAADRQAGRL